MLSFCQWLQATPWASAIRYSLSLYPVLYTIHIFGFVTLVTATSFLNLRLLGWCLRDWSISNVSKLALPWAKAGFTVQIVTGFLVFASQAVSMYNNTAFRVKMLMVLLAGANIVLLHTATYRGERGGETQDVAPLAAKVTAAFSMLIWFGIVAMSRVIGFTANS
jgi:hypothetical protein